MGKSIFDTIYAAARSAVILAAPAAFGGLPSPVFAQNTPASPSTQPAGNIAQDEARRAAEAAAQDRAARVAAPDVHLDKGRLKPGRASKAALFPVEDTCFTIQRIAVDTKLPRKLRWVPRRLTRFEGRCLGSQGINVILKSLEADFLDRGLITTRAGLPQQDLAKGTLHIAVIPGRLVAIKGGTGKQRRMWTVASPMHVGDLVNLREMEQALEQIRSLPGADAKADLTPGDQPGDSVLLLKVKQSAPIAASVQVNNLGGSTIGNWTGSARVTAQNLLGLNESLTVNVNNRLGDPALPANSTGSGISLNVPYGNWTFGVSASQNHYRQEIIGAVENFSTRNVLNTIAANVERMIARNSTSRTDLKVQLQRRWGRSYIDDVEIGLQHQDLTDIALWLNDRRNFGQTRLETSLGFRQGVGLLGAQQDQPGLPDNLPSARYSIASLDLALTHPLTQRLIWHSALRVQVSPRALYGSDIFSVGGPYTVRGYEGDRSVLGHSGFYLRDELAFSLSKNLQPYALLDGGHVFSTNTAPIGAGLGLRAGFKWFSLDGYVAAPLNNRGTLNQHRVQFGLTLGATL